MYLVVKVSHGDHVIVGMSRDREAAEFMAWEFASDSWYEGDNETKFLVEERE